jgi:hypothetical protein
MRSFNEPVLCQPSTKTWNFQLIEMIKLFWLKILGLRGMKFLLNFDGFAMILTCQIIDLTDSPSQIDGGLRKACLQTSILGQKGGPQLERLT